MVSERLLPHVTDVVIRNEVFGSDRCPLVIGLTDHTHKRMTNPELIGYH